MINKYKLFLTLICITILVLLPFGSFAAKENEINSLSNYENNEVIIKLKSDNQAHLIKFSGQTDINQIIDDYSNNEQVEYIEPNYIYKISMLPNDMYFGKQWYLQKTNLTSVWDFVKESPEITVAVLDTGVDITHPDLAENIWTNNDEIIGDGKDNDKNGFIDDVHGYDFVARSADPSPKFEDNYNEAGMHHGTVISGIIGAVGNNGIGISGVSWKIKIMPLRVLNSEGEGNVKNVEDAVNYAINNGADIINMSFVGYDYSSTLYSVLKKAYDKGIVIVAAAGNTTDGSNGTNLNQVRMYPICYDAGKTENIILGITATDEYDKKASFANYGSDCVDLAAPGTKFYGTQYYNPINNKFLDYYGGLWSGTSLAAPVVTGTVALIEAVKSSLSVSQIYQIVAKNTDDISSLNPQYLANLGSGRINALKALNSAIQTSSGSEVKIMPRETSTGQEVTPINHEPEKMLTLPEVQDEKILGLIVGPQSKVNKEIKLLDYTGIYSRSFVPFGKDIKIATSVAMTDFSKDGSVEIIVGAGEGGGPQVRIFDRMGNVKGQFFAYAKTFLGGVNIAVGDTNGDGNSEIITSPASNGGSQIRIFNSNGRIVNSGFFAFNSSIRSGFSIATCDLNNDSKEEILVGAGKGMEPYLKIFNSDGKMLRQYLVYDTRFRGGVNVACGDLNNDGSPEIATAPARNGGPHIRIFNYNGLLISQFFAYSSLFTGGVSIAIGDADNNGSDEIITGPGPSGSAHVRIFDIKGVVKSQFFAYDEIYTGGINVSALK